MKWLTLILAIITLISTSGCGGKQPIVFRDTDTSSCKKEYTELSYDKIGDSYQENQEIWSEINERYRGVKNRKLLVFMDGTGNDKTDSSNIRVLYRLALAQSCTGKPIIPYYDKGVGAKFFDSVLGGATGEGASLNIRQAYRFLVNTYDPGDEIYIFGFSRGAFTARSLNGFIEFAGILNKNSIKEVWTDNLPDWFGVSTVHYVIKDIFDEYRVKNDGTDNFDDKVRIRIEKYKKENFPDLVFERAVVKAIGVFDTVPALGLGTNDEPDNHRLDLYASNGFHALSLDEQRDKFRLLRFDDVKLKPGQKLREVWFPGVHGNIGGGYSKTIGCDTISNNSENYYNGLEAIPLNWMIEQLREENLFRIDGQFPECVDGILHDEYFESSLLYKNMGTFRRKPSRCDVVHESVVLRIGLDKLFKANKNREIGCKYSPSNLQHPVQQYYQVEPAHQKIAGEKAKVLEPIKK
ncbi:MAG: DUF2235 domain-containing protein [Desulforhopalus sp.]|nr:DUF2235 domain-containing protein [Desulforhopalus sp.]